LKALAIVLALVDFAPVFFLALGLFFLAQLVDRLEPRCRRMSLAGLALVTLAGLAGAASNLSLAVLGEAIPLLAATTYVFGAPGFTLVAAALFRARATVREKRVERDPWLVPAVVSWAFLIAAFYLNDSLAGAAWARVLAVLVLMATIASCFAAAALGWRRQLHMAAALFAFNAAGTALVLALRSFAPESIWIQAVEALVNLAAQSAFAFASWRVAAEYHARVGPTAGA
jgi:hypothetical protein